jgi:steroid delta-isomerase-like uncharacterized protein
MSTEENKAIVRRFLEAFSNADLAVIDEMITPNVVNHTALAQLRYGAEDFKRLTSLVKSIAPDQQWEIEDMIAEGDKVAIRCTWSGTQQGPYLLAPATGKRFSVQHIHIFRLADGKVAEHWAIRDDLGMLQQLGAIPTSGQPG